MGLWGGYSRCMQLPFCLCRFNFLLRELKQHSNGSTIVFDSRILLAVHIFIFLYYWLMKFYEVELNVKQLGTKAVRWVGFGETHSHVCSTFLFCVFIFNWVLACAKQCPGLYLKTCRYKRKLNPEPILFSCLNMASRDCCSKKRAQLAVPILEGDASKAEICCSRFAQSSGVLTEHLYKQERCKPAAIASIHLLSVITQRSTHHKYLPKVYLPFFHSSPPH